MNIVLAVALAFLILMVVVVVSTERKDRRRKRRIQGNGKNPLKEPFLPVPAARLAAGATKGSIEVSVPNKQTARI